MCMRLFFIDMADLYLVASVAHSRCHTARCVRLAVFSMLSSMRSHSSRNVRVSCRSGTLPLVAPRTWHAPY